MSWRVAFISRLGPGPFSGVTLSQWLKVLVDNRFSVDPPYWGRMLSVTAGSIPNTAYALLEDALYGKAVRDATVEPPVIILGIWRSGTTHLHNLLARDDRFAYPTNYQVCYPRTFLTTERLNARIVDFFVPKKRPQDNVRMGMSEPQEDEFAFYSLTGRSFTMEWSFPRRAEHYHRYLTFREAPADEVAEWKAALTGLLKKLSFKYGKPIVLKSPGHTCRVKLLLDLFPDARFVHIHRNPYDVFQSTRHMYRSVISWTTFQRTDHTDVDDRIIHNYREVYDAYFEERALIPKAQFHEVAYHDLEADPLGQLRRIYEGLGFPDFGQAEPVVSRYLQSIAGYKKNTFPELPTALRERIATRWRRCFDEWGYPA
jgi:omega-hydroxy-beta-dihydromenaquinone-9 sulfotransferase